jgi:hypothetical protein
VIDGPALAPEQNVNTPVAELFLSIGDARQKLLEWKLDYNERRPHSSIGNLTPTALPALDAPPGRDARTQCRSRARDRRCMRRTHLRLHYNIAKRMLIHLSVSISGS